MLVVRTDIFWIENPRILRTSTSWWMVVTCRVSGKWRRQTLAQEDVTSGPRLLPELFLHGVQTLHTAKQRWCSPFPGPGADALCPREADPIPLACVLPQFHAHISFVLQCAQSVDNRKNVNTFKSASLFYYLHLTRCSVFIYFRESMSSSFNNIGGSQIYCLILKYI